MSKELDSKAAMSRLSGEEQAAISRAKQRVGGAERRRHLRLPLDERFPLLMRVEGQGSSGTYIQVNPRDLSTSGIGFFHVAYMHPGTPVSFIMKNRKGEVATAKGTILRCQHVSGRVHEVGAVFEREIEVEVYVSVPHDAVATESAQQDANEVYTQVAVIAEQLKSLASERAALEEILNRIGKLAFLVSPEPSTSPGPVPVSARVSGLKGDAAGGHGPSPR